MEKILQVAHGALAVLIAVIAIYVAVRFMGKLAKIVIFVILLVLALWLVFSEKSFLHEYIPFLYLLPAAQVCGI